MKIVLKLYKNKNSYKIEIYDYSRNKNNFRLLKCWGFDHNKHHCYKYFSKTDIGFEYFLDTIKDLNDKITVTDIFKYKEI